MGAIMGVMSIIETTISSMSTVASIVTIIAILAIPIFLGKKYQKSLEDDILFGFGQAYKYSFCMMLIGSIIGTVASIATIYYVGTDIMAEKITLEFIETFSQLGLTPPQAELVTLSTIYDGYGWILSALGGAAFSAAFFALISAAIIRKKEK